MQQALEKVIAKTDEAELTAAAEVKPVPTATECHLDFCPKDGHANCAYSFLPHWDQANDVGDLMVNGTEGSKWINKCTSQPRHWPDKCNDLKALAEKNAASHDWNHCFDEIKHKSYLDSKRGMYGNEKSGCVLRIPLIEKRV